MNFAELKIREVTLADESVIYKMICDLEDTVLDIRAFEAVFQKNFKAENINYFIADWDGKPVGMVSCHIQSLLHHTALVSEIQEMYVAPEYRSKQVGRELMNHVVFYAKSKGAIQMEVTSRATRENAHRFYQKEGFAKSHVKLVRYFNLEK